jgi:hypothetical protein
MSDVPKEGYIYVLINDAYNTSDGTPIIKIGESIHTEQRCSELAKVTGVPGDFKIAYQIKVDHRYKREAMIHKALILSRWNPHREFFKISVIEAIKVIEEQVSLPLPIIVASVNKSKKLNKMIKAEIAKKVLNILGLTVPCLGKTWTDNEWHALLPQFESINDTDISLWGQISSAFNLRHRYAVDKNRSPALHLYDDLRRILKECLGMQLIYKNIGDPMQINISGAAVKKADEAVFKATHREKLQANADFLPTKLKEGIKPKSRHPAVDWEPGFSKSDRGKAIEAHLNELWKAETVCRGGTERKFYQLMEFSIVKN